MNPAKKKFTKKFKSPSNLHEKSFINWSDLEQKLQENSFEIWSVFILKGNPCCFFPKSRLLDPFLKNVGLAVWFWKSLGQHPNLSKIFNPQEICPDNFSFVYKYIWV